MPRQRRDRARPPQDTESPSHITQTPSPLIFAEQPTLVDFSPQVRVLDAWGYRTTSTPSFILNGSETSLQNQYQYHSPSQSQPPASNSPPAESVLFNAALPDLVRSTSGTNSALGIISEETPLFSEHGRPLPQPPSTLSIELDDSIGSLDLKVEQFIKCNSQRTDNSLSFIWSSDQHGLLGRLTLRDLFDRLRGSEDDLYCPIKSFRRMVFFSPAKSYKGPFHLLGSHPSGHDCVDFINASSLRELSWQGDIFLLMGKCLNVPFDNLSALSISSSDIPVQTAVAILHSCPNLSSVELGTVDDTQARGNLTGNYQIASSTSVCFAYLSALKLGSNEEVETILGKVQWGTLTNLTLILAGRGLNDLSSTISRLQVRRIRNLALMVPKDIDNSELDSLRSMVDDITLY
ncbi:hypothetical protein NLJ89_g2254 [Agrocybe chaxingu]|uniref:Uncharacterized protein n=1 Tax=Agrocybe chaxingu TaxID=84603 RepID=A0A9W8K758_9AGAR|nr:hypothetical protein NLJ89_g2254 [Agrocybe chaxingu]